MALAVGDRVPILAAGRPVVVAALALGLAAVVPASAAPSCTALEHADDRPLPAPAACLRRFDVASAHDGAGNAATARRASADALFAAAKAADAAGRFDEAEAAIDCADAVLGPAADGPAREELLRLRGVLDYHRERIPQALSRFECGLQRATAREDRAAIARDLRNVGSALRRLGDYHGALAALTRSLEMQRAAGGEVQGSVYNNLADVFRDLGKSEQAIRYYHDALETFDRRGDAMNAAHVRQTLATLALDRGDVRAAQPLLESALAAYRDAGKRVYMLRAYAMLIRAALADGDTVAARRWSADAFALAAAHDLPVPASLQREAARTERLTGQPAAAERRLRAAFAALSDADSDRAALLEELAEALEAQGRHPEAFAALREAHALSDRLAQARQDRQSEWLRTRFESTERERRIAVLEAERRQRILLTWLALAATLAAALAAALVLLRRRARARRHEIERQALHAAELARYRREAESLLGDRAHLQSLLDSREDALCLLDAEGQVLAANRAAVGLLVGAEDMALPVALSDLLDPADRAAFAAALERMEDAVVQRLALTGRGGRPVEARLEPWSHGDGWLVLALRPRTAGEAERPDDPAAAQAAGGTSAQAVEPAADQAADAGGPAPAPIDAAAAQEAFRRALVELMLAVVEAWERSTGSGRLELAEKSRIWAVNIDDGRLRARAMERYLSLAKLPQRPRWRDVLRSAYFVLGQCPLDEATRADLQARVDAILSHTRRSALL